MSRGLRMALIAGALCVSTGAFAFGGTDTDTDMRQDTGKSEGFSELSTVSAKPGYHVGARTGGGFNEVHHHDDHNRPAAIVEMESRMGDH